MPRRTSNRVISPSSATYQSSTLVHQPPSSSLNPNVLQLRRQWKWAAVSQFFFTFSPLFITSDFSLADVENDLAYSTNRVLSKIMQRLLVLLTQDRKISADSWQYALRRQYLKRNPDANPIGPLEQMQLYTTESSRASTVAPAVPYDSSDAHASKEPEDEVSQPGLLDETPPTNGLSTQIEDSQEGRATPESPKVEEHDPPTDLSRQIGSQINWLELPMLTKLDSLHTLVEWQFQNPFRLRSQMKNDDENAQWRIEPIGYDTKKNAYWLIGADRLWVQREPPKDNTKRKRKTEPQRSLKKHDRKLHRVSTPKRKRLDDEPQFDEQPSRSTRQRVQANSSSHSRGSRAAKARANEKLDAQAKDFAAFQRHMATSTRTRTSKSNPSPRAPLRPAGIRVSARLRGASTIDDEWQEIPEEWLSTEVMGEVVVPKPAPSPSPSERPYTKTGLESDSGSISDLTELSDAESESGVGVLDTVVELNEDEAALSTSGSGLAGSSRAQDDTSDDDLPEEKAEAMEVSVMTSESSSTPLPDGFIEWETICVTLEEWEDIAIRFEKATHYTEKALHKVLSQHIVPIVTAELREAERKRRMDDAVVHRKRSSRIALKELEKEEERLARKKREDEEEKMSRARRLEARQRKEEEERLKREIAREQRRKEREMREQRMSEEKEAEPKAETAAEAASQASMQETRVGSSSTSLTVVSVNGRGSGSRTPAENWELDCEVCHRRGFNQDDGMPIMCCGVCSKWQHISCHDRQDVLAHRPKRNWDREEFICQQCQLRTMKASPANNQQNIAPEPRGTTYTPGSQPYYNYSRNYINGRYYQAAAPSGRYTYENQTEMRSSPLHPSQLYPHQPRSSNVTFSHYQPQGSSFSPSRPTYSVAHATQQSQYSHHTPQPVQGTGIHPYRPSFQV
ncbi:hypothetical protein J3A83DRAFT_4259622 [Scleroderma citrinum]